MGLSELTIKEQKVINKIAERHTLSIDEVIHYYIMGGEYADTLCELRDLGMPEEYIIIRNKMYWKEKINNEKGRI